MQTNWVLELALDFLIVVAVAALVVYTIVRSEKVRSWSLMTMAAIGLSFGTAAVLKRLPIPLPQDQVLVRANGLLELVLDGLVVVIVIAALVCIRAREDRSRRRALAVVVTAGGVVRGRSSREVAYDLVMAALPLRRNSNWRAILRRVGERAAGTTSSGGIRALGAANSLTSTAAASAPSQ